ncbi:hypothetical protein D3C87_1798350 [compost metagenome]
MVLVLDQGVILQPQPQLAIAGNDKTDRVLGRDNAPVQLLPLGEIGLACADGVARPGGIAKELGDIFNTHSWSSSGWLPHNLFLNGNFCNSIRSHWKFPP